MAASFLLALSCGETFTPPSAIESLRVLAVRVDEPYAKPGEEVRLDMLVYDGSPRAVRSDGTRRPVQVLWVSGCENPPGDAYFACYSSLAAKFPKASPSDAGGAGGGSNSRGASGGSNSGGASGGSNSGGASGGSNSGGASGRSNTGGAGGAIKTGGASGSADAGGNAGNAGGAPPTCGAGGAGGTGGTSDLGVKLPPGTGFGETFRAKISEDILAGRAGPGNGLPPYGLAYVFFFACGGRLGPASDGGGVYPGIPLGCFDECTGAPLGQDDFVFGYTPVYSYSAIRNENPRVRGGSFRGVALSDASCVANDGCSAGQRCGSQHVCLPVVPACTEPYLKDCPEYAFGPDIDPASAELDPTTAGADGDLQESIWVSYYASSGRFNHDLKLVNDARQGWNADYGAAWKAPHGASGETRLWSVVHDSRGGTAWWWHDVIVE